MIMAVSRSATSSFSSSSTCAWMVTSSAVVGSSQISSAGLQASAIAISARCRIPPDIWWGYSLSRRRGSGMPQRRSSSAASALASPRDTSEWRSSTSVTWTPIGTTGFSELIGSWKTMAISRPRRSFSVLAPAPSRSGRGSGSDR